MGGTGEVGGGGVLVNNLHDWKAKELSLPQSARIVVLYCGMTHSIHHFSTQPTFEQREKKKLSLDLPLEFEYQDNHKNKNKNNNWRIIFFMC